MILTRTTAAALALVLIGASECGSRDNIVIVSNGAGEVILVTVEGSPTFEREVAASRETALMISEETGCVEGPLIVEGAESGRRADLGTPCGGDTIRVHPGTLHAPSR